MSARRTIRQVAAAVLSLTLLSLAACGDDGEDASGAGLEGVTIQAEPGKAPEVEWSEKLEPSDIETEVLHEGDGEETADGDSVLAHIWIGNGFTQEKVFDSHEAGGAQMLTISDNLAEGLRAALEGHPLGSVVAVSAPAEKAFGEQGNPSLGLGNGDSVLFVSELVSTVPQEATGKERKPAAWAPKVSFADGEVPTIDFTGTPEPTGKLQVTTLVEGEGPVVKKGQSLVVHYVGQVHKGEEPFDSSYSRGEPATFPIGVGQVVKGWDQSLVGQKVGSRVIVQIPPKLGYGSKGQPDAGIKGKDTLVFVVDILAAL